VNLNKILCFIFKKKINSTKFLQKYQAFPAVVAFNQGLPIFHFLL
jgi:hypothetical protein